MQVKADTNLLKEAEDCYHKAFSLEINDSTTRYSQQQTILKSGFKN